MPFDTTQTAHAVLEASSSALEVHLVQFQLESE
jgi:hypothetical protein